MNHTHQDSERPRDPSLVQQDLPYRGDVRDFKSKEVTRINEKEKDDRRSYNNGREKTIERTREKFNTQIRKN